MLERYLIDHCSPTLASLKTANMFSCPYESGESLEEDVRKWNLQMKDKGLCLTILRKNDKKALVYLCRPQRLEQDLHKPGVQKFLRACGYRGEHWEEALTELKDRLHMCEKFPHEIGLFLDYPLVDVIGFIRNTGKTVSVPVAGKPMVMQKKQRKHSADTKNAERSIPGCGKMAGAFCS